MATRHVGLELNLAVSIKKDHETGLFVVFSPSLQLAAQGRTRSQAVRNFYEAAQLFFESCVERGTLDDALTELGWRRVGRPKPRWIPPEILEQRNLSVRIPALGA